VKLLRARRIAGFHDGNAELSVLPLGSSYFSVNINDCPEGKLWITEAECITLNLNIKIRYSSGITYAVFQPSPHCKLCLTNITILKLPTTFCTTEPNGSNAAFEKRQPHEERALASAPGACTSQLDGAAAVREWDETGCTIYKHTYNRSVPG
jgi:hypothetical protein